ncbi:MAG: methionine gamma-lyase family protein [Candidatus Obscuribacterales bacterium]|nr:methionine gamma-lyase family protein [Candidatus Obscuribacterales bacterium]
MSRISTSNLVEIAEEKLAPVFKEIDEIALLNQKKVLDSFRKHRVSPELFAEKTGYGIDDYGREVIDAIFAEIQGAQSAAVRMQMVSGTHALACGLLGNLNAGDELLVVTGTPYDTMMKVLGLTGSEAGSLAQLGVIYREINLIPELDKPDQLRSSLAAALNKNTRMVYIQKSCGYSIERPTILNKDVRILADLVHELNSATIVMVDNCYGEYVEELEPVACGADLVAGSLIKNPGAGLAVAGGYLAGKQRAVDNALNRLTAPGIGGHLGHSFNQNRLLYQGMFMAPSIVAGAVKGAHLFAQVFTELGFEVNPAPGKLRGDIIQAIKFGNPERLVNFLAALQQFSPVDAHVRPEPANMPGYEDQVIMAGGSFIEGSTIELSGDGPLRPPFVAFVQGGLTYLHIKLALLGILELASSGDYRFI